MLCEYVIHVIYIYISKGIPSTVFSKFKSITKIAALQAQLHVMTNNHTIYEHILLNGFREIAFTRSYYVTKFHNSYKLCRIKMATQQAHLHVMTNNPTKYEHKCEKFQTLGWTDPHGTIFSSEKLT